jgi:hypothetical protein
VDPLETPSHPAQFLLCEECRAPVDPAQRYCVNCGSRQTHAANPAVDYFAAAARQHRTVGASPRQARALSLPLLALFFLVLPLAAAIGVLAGRSSNSGDGDLIAALRNQRPATVTVSAGPTSPTGPTAAAGDVASAGSVATKASSPAKGATTPATTKTAYGAADKIAGSKVTAQELKQGAQAVDNINKAVGQNYVDATQNLPATVVVPATPGAGSNNTAPPSAARQP